MDSTTAGGLGIFGIIMSAGGLIYSSINHKKFKCRCCGKDLDASIDIDPTEPVIVKVEPEEPPLPPLPPRKKTRRASVAPESDDES